MNIDEVVKFTDAFVFAKAGVHLNDLQRIIIKSACSGQGYEHIAKTNGYSPNYLKQDAGPKLWQLLSNVFGEKVKKNTFKGAIERQAALVYRFAADDSDLAVANVADKIGSSTISKLAGLENLTVLPANINQHSQSHQHYDWGEAPDVSVFYGRNQEQSALEQWISTDKCRIVSILGMGGIGKTHLSVKIAEALKSEFDFIIWRSLENEPSLEEILNSLLKSFTKTEKVVLPETVDRKISLLLDYLRKHRSLLILDNVETILYGGENIGQYKSGFENYGNLFQRLGECHHQSCLIITSRDKVKEFALMEGDNSPVRCMYLKDLNIAAGKQILQHKGCYSSNDDEYKYLVEQYSGNPLTLKIAAVAIKELFQGDINQFIQHETLVIDEIYNLLHRQFNRLPSLAKTILYWLAIHRQPVSISQLLSEINPQVSQQKLMGTLRYLIQSSLIENKGNKFTLKRILMDFVTTLLVEEACQDIVTGKLDLLNKYELLKIETQGSTRKTQINFIIKPIIQKLIAIFPNQKNLGTHLKNMNSKIEEYHQNQSGYVAENIFNLICHVPNNLIGYSIYNYKYLQPQDK